MDRTASRRRLVGFFAGIALALSCGVKEAGTSALERTTARDAVSSGATQDGQPATASWPRVQIGDPITANLVRRVLNEASRQFLDARCRTLLTEFHDQRGRPLISQLTDLKLDISTYLSLITFTDHSGYRACARDAVAVTMPGSRVVHVCGVNLVESWRRIPHQVVAVLIHEILHTLGLGENPPESSYITERVVALCK